MEALVAKAVVAALTIVAQQMQNVSQIHVLK
jgi:hypothetical protein